MDDLCATALLAAAAVATPAAAGLYLEQTVASSGEGQGMQMDVRAWAEGDNVRVEYLVSNNPILPTGSYLLTRDGGQKVHLVRPQEQTYSTWDLNAMFNMLGQINAAAGGMMQIDFKDPMTEPLGSEPGGELLGYDTTHHTWRTGYTLDMKLAFMDQSSRMEATTQAWVTDELGVSGLNIWFKASPPTTGDPELDQVLTAHMAQIDGVVLKLRQDSTTTDKKGRTTNSSMTMEITTAREEPVDAAMFEMPEGFTETPLIPMPAMQGEEGQENPMDALKGLFGRKGNDG